MVGILNPNISRVTQEYAIIPPRDKGRGSALTSTGIERPVSYVNGYVVVNTEQLFPLEQEPILLDVSFDQLDRPLVTYQTIDSSFLWFYNTLLADYAHLDIGSVSGIAICNDFSLYGDNVICVYLIDKVIHYRLQSDRFSVDYTLNNKKVNSIYAFGIGKETNSMNVICEKNDQ